MFFPVTFKSNPTGRGHRKRMVKIWAESARFNATRQRLANQARMTLKKC